MFQEFMKIFFVFKVKFENKGVLYFRNFRGPLFEELVIQ